MRRVCVVDFQDQLKRDVLDLVRDRRLQLGWKGQLANEWLEGLVLVVPRGSKLTAKDGSTMSEIANKRRVENSVRKDVTASVELEALKGCSIRCTRHDLYCVDLVSIYIRECLPVLATLPAVSLVPPRKARSPRPLSQSPTTASVIATRTSYAKQLSPLLKVLQIRIMRVPIRKKVE